MSMQTVNGVISEVDSKDFPGRNGGPAVTLHSFRIEGDGRWYRTNKVAVPHAVGTPVGFVVNTQGNKVDASTFTVSDGAEAASAPPPAAAPAAQSNGSGYKGYANKSQFFDAKDAYWDKKEVREQEVVEPRITLTAAQNSAIALVTSALANDALSFGSAAKGKKLDMLLEMVDEVADRFYQQRLAVRLTEGE